MKEISIRRLLVLLTFIFIAWDPGLPTSIRHVVDAINDHHYYYPQEKFYLHTDKPYYAFGETIWFKVYGVLATSHLPVTPSGLVYVDLLDESGQLLTRRNIKMENGTGIGDLTLSPEFRTSTTMILRAYSIYNLNFNQDFIFQKRIKVYDSLETELAEEKMNPSASGIGDMSIGVYPEGGELVRDIESLVAVRINDSEGFGQEVRARVFDQDDRLVTLFVTNPLGYGYFSLTPQLNQKYYVRAELNGQTFSQELPESLPFGTSLSIKHIGSNTLAIFTRTNLEQGLKGAAIVGHIRGAVFYKVNLDTIAAETILIPTDDIPEGIAHFTLLQNISEELEPVAERLVYIDSRDQQEEIVHLRLKKYSKVVEDQSISIEIDLTAQVIDSQKISASLSVYPALPTVTTSMDISTYLNFVSDVTGTIENPGFYFERGELTHPKELDLVMLTHGWRRFRWEEILSDQSFDLKYVPENGFSIRGTTTNVTGSKGIPSSVTLSFLKHDFAIHSTDSDQKGQFEFFDLQIHDTTSVILNGYKKRKRPLKKAVKNAQGSLPIELEVQPVPDQAYTIIPEVEINSNQIQDYLNVVRNTPIISKAYENIWSIDLEEIRIKATRIDPIVEVHRNEMLYKEPDTRILIETDPVFVARGATSNIYEILRGFPGVELGKDHNGRFVVLRGVATIKGDPRAIVLLNGSRVSDATLNQVVVGDISFVDIIRSISKSSIYGSNTGVIAVYTKDPLSGVGKSEDIDYTIKMNHPGYYRIREFSSIKTHPIEVAIKEDAIKPASYSTVAWKPDLVFTTDSTKIFILVEPVSPKLSYIVDLQGITSEGLPISVTNVFSSEDF